MIAKLKRLYSLSHVNSNRIIYIALFLAIIIFAFVSGERLAYLSALVLFVLPIVSYVLTFITLRTLSVKQTAPTTIVKQEQGVLLVRLHNPAPLPFINMECIFFGNEHTMETIREHRFNINPLSTAVHEIPFVIKYRGRYQIGLDKVYANDFMGLFRLSYNHGSEAEIISMPQILDLANIPLIIDVVSETSSRFDIKDEDYATIADIRSYLPTDSIKRVHWKLTAKRNEWLVKIFQSNALNCITAVLDNQRLPIQGDEMYILEDKMVEYSLGLARFCLRKGMPVDFIITDGSKTRAQTMQNFDTIYQLTGGMQFQENPPITPASVLTHMLNDSTNYVNSVVFTAKLDIALYERVINVINKGNYTAIMYFTTEEPNPEYERIYNLMEEAGLPCFRITHEVMFDVA